MKWTGISLQARESSVRNCGLLAICLPVMMMAACQDAPLQPVPAGEEVEGPSQHHPALEGFHSPPDDIRTGFIVGRDGKPLQITFEVHDGLAVWEGDIVLGPASEVPATRQELESLVQRRSQAHIRFGVVIDGSGFRWPGGVVPYEIDPTLANPSGVTDAIAMIEESTAGVTFVPRTDQDNYIVFSPSDDACSSPVGMGGGQQTIQLASPCTAFPGVAAHEILHSLGMYHEHTRCDRDMFVKILLDNVATGHEGNFDKRCSGATDIGEYDEGSIMHYSPLAFSKDFIAPTIVSLRGRDDDMGQRDGLGPTDILTINTLYGVNNVAPTGVIAPLAASYPEGSPVNFDGSGSSDPDDSVLTYSWNFGDGTCAGGTPPAACSQKSPTHTYSDNGSYVVTLTVSDGFLTDDASTTATIVNVEPLVTAGADATVTSGEILDLAGSFSDPGIEDDPWDWEIDWGFGSNTTGSTNDQSAPILASRQVCAIGQYSVVLSVTDKDGGTGSDALTLTVPASAVMVDISPGGNTNSVNLKKKGVLPVAVLSTPTFDALEVDPSKVVLGDGMGAGDTPVAQRKNGSYHTGTEDVNRDGLLDLVLKFRVPDLVANGDLTPTSTTLVLRGSMKDGCTEVRGEGQVTTRP